MPRRLQVSFTSYISSRIKPAFSSNTHTPYSNYSTKPHPKKSNNPTSSLVMQSVSHLPPLRLLSLDGGGVRGLSALMILKDIMDSISNEEKKLKLRDPENDTPLKPCDYFDLIGGKLFSYFIRVFFSILTELKGTSTGGIIAILLSRLRLDVPTCIKIYTSLAEEVFKNDRSIKVFGVKFRLTHARFSGLILERAIKSVLKDNGFDSEEDMWDGSLFEDPRFEPDTPQRQPTDQLPKMAVAENGKLEDVPQEIENGHSSMESTESMGTTNKQTLSKTNKNTGSNIVQEPVKRAPTATKKKPSEIGCHGLVVAVYKHAVGLPKLFCTDDPNDKETKIWQALRATSAAPTFFEEISFGTPKITYIDGGLGYNSPCVEIDAQAKSIWKGRAIGCVVSIGTGLQTIPNIKKTGWLPFDDLSIASAIVQMATSTTRVDNEMQRMYRDTETEYYRWDVDTGLGDISLEQWMREDEMASATQIYMEDSDQNLRKMKLANTIARLSASPKVIECSAGIFKVGMRENEFNARDPANPTIPGWLLEDLDLKTGFPLGMTAHAQNGKARSEESRSMEHSVSPVEMDLDGDGNRSEARIITCCRAENICLRTLMSNVPQGRYSIRFTVCFYDQDPSGPVDSPQTRNFHYAWPEAATTSQEGVDSNPPINLIFSAGRPYDSKTFTHRYVDPVISADIVPVLLHPDAIRVRVDEDMLAQHQGKGWFEIRGDIELDVGLEGDVGIVISKISEKKKHWIGGWSFGGVRLVPARLD